MLGDDFLSVMFGLLSINVSCTKYEKQSIYGEKFHSCSAVPVVD